MHGVYDAAAENSDAVAARRRCGERLNLAGERHGTGKRYQQWLNTSALLKSAV